MPMTLQEDIASRIQALKTEEKLIRSALFNDKGFSFDDRESLRKDLDKVCSILNSFIALAVDHQIDF